VSQQLENFSLTGKKPERENTADAIKEGRDHENNEPATGRPCQQKKKRRVLEK